MKGKRVLAALLLGVGLCFVPALGYGEVMHRAWEMDSRLLEARIDYIMYNPTNFLDVRLYYYPIGHSGVFPEGVDTKEKICVLVRDNRGVFSDKSGVALVGLFERVLESIRVPIFFVAPDLDTDIVAKFISEGGIPLGYFYQGEYHLWGE